MQIKWLPFILQSALIVSGILFILYISLKTCSGGIIVRNERKGGTPRADDMTVTSSSYGFETSYAPGNRASSAGPLPVGGRVERPPTRSFSSYTDPRTESKKSDNQE